MKISMLSSALLLVTSIIFQTTPGMAQPEKEGNRTLRLLLDKGIITQQEYDQAVEEEHRAAAEEEQRTQDEAQRLATAQAEPLGTSALSFRTKHGLQVTMGGFLEIDFIGDSTRSFREIIGNQAVLRSDTVGGANSQLISSPRNSRITFDVQAPEREGIKSRLYFAMDFLGNQSAYGPSTGLSEYSYYGSPVPRIFQLYFKVESSLVDVKVGQDWSQFGFMSQYSRGTVSVAATPANMFNRWIQASLSKELRLTDTLSLTPVFSIERPPQADDTLPSFVTGVQLAYHVLQAPYTGASSNENSLKPLSFQISGVGRRLEANSGGPTSASGTQPSLNSQSHVTGWGISSALFLPILPSRDGTMGNTAHLVMEGVTGAGIADMFNGLSWGICNPACGGTGSTGFGGAAFGQTNIDGGLAAVNSQTGTFEAIRTTSMMVHATYYLPDDGKTWIGGGYGTIYSSNANQMTCTVSAAFCGGAVRTAQSIYIRDSTYYAYLFHDFTPEIRAGLETNWVRTTYADGVNAENRRIQLSLFWRF